MLKSQITLMKDEMVGQELKRQAWRVFNLPAFRQYSSAGVHPRKSETVLLYFCYKSLSHQFYQNAKCTSKLPFPEPSNLVFRMENLPKDFWVTTQAFTKTTYRDVYPSIDPTTNPDLSQAGKIIIITGASRGIGRVRSRIFLAPHDPTSS